MYFSRTTSSFRTSVEGWDTFRSENGMNLPSLKVSMQPRCKIDELEMQLWCSGDTKEANSDFIACRVPNGKLEFVVWDFGGSNVGSRTRPCLPLRGKTNFSCTSTSAMLHGAEVADERSHDSWTCLLCLTDGLKSSKVAQSERFFLLWLLARFVSDYPFTHASHCTLFPSVFWNSECMWCSGVVGLC